MNTSCVTSHKLLNLSGLGFLICTPGLLTSSKQNHGLLMSIH